MKKVLIILPIVLVLLIAIPFIFRFIKDIKKKLHYPNTYAIQNVQTGKNIRVFNAVPGNETPMILYSNHNWECMTWELIQLEDGSYLLKNLYTEKTFQPSSSLKSGVSLWQQPMGGTSLQYWEFLKQSDNTYLIRLKGTELYVTITSDKNDSPIVLMPMQNSNSQLWKLVRQNSWI
jgi:Ricin-type beta-trefoil lectin domain.